MTNLDEKYVVFKAKEYYSGNAEPIAPDDIFVLRSSDVFASPALYSYAHLIRSALELDDSHHFMPTATRAYLDELVDGVLGLADGWDRTASREPDE